MEHPAIEHLAGTPDVLRHLMTGLSEEQANWKPAPDRWSIAEVLEHISHVEGHMFRPRLDLMTSAEVPAIETYDETSFDYSGREAEESFAHFEERREDNVEFLRSLEQKALNRAGIHSEKGRFTIEDMLNMWAFHDLGHIRQITELVRAQLYFPKLGIFQAAYKVQP